MMMAGTRRIGPLAFLMGMWLPMGVSSVQADGLSEAEVQVWTIRATKANEEISEKLEPLAKALAKDFKFTGYELTKTDSKTVPIDKEFKVKLLGPYKMVVTPLERTDDQATLKIEVSVGEGKKKKSKLNSTIRLKPGKFQLMGGWKLSGGDVLIVAVSAK